MMGYLLGANFLEAGKTETEVKLLHALEHAVRKDHELNPVKCQGCLDICAWLTEPGYQGQQAGPI